MNIQVPMTGILVMTMILSAALGCKRDTSSELKGQANTTMVFYGLAVDQDGRPLPDAHFEYQVDAYPKDWTFDTRGRPYDISNVSATTNADGRFTFEVSGCFLKMRNVNRSGYRHFWDQDTSDGSSSTYAYQLIAWSDLCYKSDPEQPAVYVFVQDGIHEVSALPCKGGYNSGNGKHWTLNKPGWPKNPSLKDVVYKRPMTPP